MDELVRVFATGSAIEGELIKGRLEVEGIPVLLKGEGEGPYRMGPAEIFVPVSFEAQARLVLESIGELPDDQDTTETEPRSDD
jgi:Putative prokaryotic signal transducing protein